MSDPIFIESEWKEFVRVEAALEWRKVPQQLDPGLVSGLSPAERVQFDRISHPRRKLEWLESRAIKTELAKRIGPGSGKVHLSISHSYSQAQGIVIGIAARGDDIRGIGVDLECRTRHMDEHVRTRVISSEESSIAGLDPMDFWVIKEAAFKAVPQNQGKVLSNFKVRLWDRNTGIGELEPQKLLFKLVHLPDWRIAFVLAL